MIKSTAIFYENANINKSQLRSRGSKVQHWMWGIWAERKAREEEFSLFVAWSSGAIGFSRFAIFAGIGFCLGSSTTNSRSLCCQHLGVGGRKHRAVMIMSSALVTCLVLVLVIPVSIADK